MPFSESFYREGEFAGNTENDEKGKQPSFNRNRRMSVMH